MSGKTINRVFRSSFPDAEQTGFRTNAWQYGVPETPQDLKPLHSTMLHALATAAKLEDSVGITLLPERKGEPKHISYRALYHRVVNAAKTLKTQGVEQGDRVLLVLPTGLEFVEYFFAIQFVGAIAVPVYPPVGLRMKAGLERIVHVANHSKAKLCISDTRIKQVLGVLGTRSGVKNILTVDQLVNPEDDDTQKFRSSSEDFSFVQYTSGSTGAPKGVLLTHKNLVTNIHAIGQAFKINRNDVVVGWCPLYHDMGLIGTLLLSIYWRVPFVMMSPMTFLMRPRKWLQAITDYKGTLSPSPSFGYGMCVKRIKPEDREGLDLSTWRLALNGAEPVNYRTVVDFQNAFEPYGFSKDAMFPVYGLAEATLAVAFPLPGSPIRYEVVDRQELANGRSVLSKGKGSMAVVACGNKMPGHDVIVVDEKGLPLREREVGHIVARGDSVMHGYFQDEEASAGVLQDGWLWTGDLGYFADNQLYITGRAKDLIIIRGRNIYAEDIERVVERIEGVRPSSVVAFGVYDEDERRELVVVIAETKVTDTRLRAQIANEVNEKVAEFCELNLDEFVLVDPGTIPKTSSGKRQRSLCRELYLKGELKPARLGKAQLGMVFVKSKAGLALMKAKGLFSKSKRRSPD